MTTVVYYWLEAIAPNYSPGRRWNSNALIHRFEARLALKPLKTSYDNEHEWEWPGQQVGSIALETPDGTQIPDTLHLLAHYHDNYFDCTLVFTDLKEAKAKYAEMEQRAWEEVKQNKYIPDGNGIVKMSKYLCTLVHMEDGSLDTPDKGSTWCLLAHVRIES